MKDGQSTTKVKKFSNKEKDITKTLRDKAITLSLSEIVQQADNIIEFLKFIHPHTSEEHYEMGGIEIRPVKRDRYEFEYVKSYNTFRFTSPKDRELLIKFLTKINGKGFCLYYSIFTFNKEGKEITINKDNALFTTTLMADFDNMDQEKFNHYKKMFESVGLETYDIFSGNGVQSLILLTRRCYDKEILRKFTELLIAKGFDVDSAIVDPSRVARLAYTRNNKELDQTLKDKYNPIDPELPLALPLNKIPRRHSIVEVFEKLNQLPTIIPVSSELASETSQEAIETIEQNQTQAITFEEREEVKNSKKKEVEVNIFEAKAQYDKYLDFDALPTTVQKILASHTVEGLRNKVLLFLIPFFKNDMGFKPYEAQAVLRIWGSRCNPVIEVDEIDKEVERLWKYKVDYKTGYYTQELAQVYGYLDMTVIRDRSSLSIPHAFLELFKLKEFNPGVARFYLMLLLAFHRNKDLLNVTFEESAKIADVSEKTAKRHMKVLINNGLIIAKKRNQATGTPQVHYPSPVTKAAGSRKVPISLLNEMYKHKELNDAEAMLYLYFKLELAYSKNGIIITSQSKIAQANAKTQPNISQLTDILSEKEYLVKETEGEGFFKKTTYELEK